MDGHICQGKLGCQEIDSKNVVTKDEESTHELLELERKMSRKDKIKSKMKKLIRKKLRSSKNEEHNFESFEFCSIWEDTMPHVKNKKQMKARTKKNQNLWNQIVLREFSGRNKWISTIMKGNWDIKKWNRRRWWRKQSQCAYLWTWGGNHGKIRSNKRWRSWFQRSCAVKKKKKIMPQVVIYYN